MFQFYVSAKDDARRCKMSLDEQMPITVTGTTDGDNGRTFIGVVYSVDEDENRPPNMRWLVTMVSERE